MIIVRLYGGMGNQMFQYALGRKLSIKYHTSLSLDVTFLLDRTPRHNFTFRDFDLDVYNIQAGIAGVHTIPYIFRKHGEGTIAWVIDAIRKMVLPHKGKEVSKQYNSNIFQCGDTIYLEGYWQSYKYFSDIIELLRNDFTLKMPLSEKAYALQQTIESASSVCIHVRRGDYVGHPFHDVSLEQNYYSNGIASIAAKTTIDALYVFSDDIEWCKQHLHFEYPTTFVDEEYSGQKGEGHMELMKHCKHFIIANSTFSWWAAWLATNPEKIVVAPKQWFKDTRRDTEDLIPKEWVRI